MDGNQVEKFYVQVQSMVAVKVDFFTSFIMLISLKKKSFPDLEQKKGSHTLQEKFHALKQNMYRKF